MSELKIAIIGRGYSVATWLAYAPWDLYIEWVKAGNSVSIDFYGDPDPWSAQVRGSGIVNHAEYMWSRARKRANAGTKIPSPRESLKNENDSIITYFQAVYGGANGDFTINDYPGMVSAVAHDGGIFTVTPQNGADVGYDLVIYGGGAGPHRNGHIGNMGDRSMDMDAFMRIDNVETQDLQGKTVALQGENAGVDVAVEVIKRGGTLFWIMSPGKSPVWLSTEHYHLDGNGDSWVDPAIVEGEEFAWLKNECEKNRVYLNRETHSIEVIAGPQDDFLNLKGKGGNADEAVDHIDFHVYAIGQDEKAEFGPFNVLRSMIQLGAGRPPAVERTDLRPVFDKNQHFGKVTDTVIGLQYKGSELSFRPKPHGLFIIGATTPAMARYAIDDGNQPQDEWLGQSGYTHHTADALPDFTDWKVLVGLVQNINTKLNQRTVLAPAQLGAVRGQLQALLAPDLRSYWMVAVGLLEALNFLKDIGDQDEGKFSYRYATESGQTPSLLAAIKSGFEYYRDLDANHPLLTDYTIDREVAGQLADMLAPHENAADINELYTITVPQEVMGRINDYVEQLQEFIDQQVNFNGMDQNALYILLTQRFPDLSDDQLQARVRDIIAKTGDNPWGIDEERTRQLMAVYANPEAVIA